VFIRDPLELVDHVRLWDRDEPDDAGALEVVEVEVGYSVN
jgi:hypothetical protein